MRLPELIPTKQPEDMAGQEFLSHWQAALAALASDPLRLVSFMAIAREGAVGLAVSELFPKIETLQGSDPVVRPSSGSVHNFRDRFVDTGLCSVSQRPFRLTMTHAGAESIALCGVLGVWQLKHGVNLNPLVGTKLGQTADMFPSQLYLNTYLRRLRILQQATVEGKTTLERADSVLGLGSKVIFETFDAMQKNGLFDYYSKLNPNDRQIEIVDDNPTETKQKRSEIIAALAKACDNYLKQDKRRITQYELITEAVKVSPRLNQNEIATRLHGGKILFFRFCDEELYGTARSVYLLKPNLREPISELLTSIYSLDEPFFRKQAESVAFKIMRQPLLVKKLLTLPEDWEDASPYSCVPEFLLKRAEELAEKQADLDYEEMKKSIERLFELGILVRGDGEKIRFAYNLKNRLSPVALRLFLRAKKLELLFYGSELTNNEIIQQVNLAHVSVEDFIKFKVIPTIHSLVTKNRLKGDTW